MKLYHVSEDPCITEFHPRPSPQTYDGINGNVVFAISEDMLHNYLLPRDCPRVCYYAKTDSTQDDISKYIGNTDKRFILNVEESSLQSLSNTKLYLYELPPGDFTILDKGAGYYISYSSVKPTNVIVIENIPEELGKYSVEVRTHVSLTELAENISKSSLQFSIIRLRNAAKYS